MENDQKLPFLPPWQERKRRLSQYRLLLAETQEERLRLGGLALRLAEKDPAADSPNRKEIAGLAAYTARVADNLVRITLLAEELQDFINTIDDSTLRRIFTLRYIGGHTWKRIAFLMHYTDESSVRKMHDRYLARRAEGDLLAACARKHRVR